MKHLLRLGLVVLSVVAISRGWATAATTGIGPNGRQLYRSYCSSCHGVDGKGNGPDAAIFTSRPRDLREGFLKAYKTDELVRRVREGKPLELALDLPALRVRAQEVEALVVYLKRLPGIDWELAASGQEDYLSRCEVCHGVTGRPGPTLPEGVRRPRDLSDPNYQSNVSDADLIRAVRHGREGMPGLTPRVSEEEGRALAAYVRLLSPGFELYSKYCATCHGNDGRGNNDLSAEIQRPKVVFDREYFLHVDPEKLHTNVWHMVRDERPMMPHFRTLLTEEQARAIVEYLQRTD